MHLPHARDSSVITYAYARARTHTHTHFSDYESFLFFVCVRVHKVTKPAEALTGWIYVEFDTGDFMKICQEIAGVAKIIHYMKNSERQNKHILFRIQPTAFTVTAIQTNLTV